MRVAVTGASGFCGGFVARAAAAAGHEVVGVGRRPGPVGIHRPWDAESGDQPDLAGADAVIHLAAAVGDPGRGKGVERRFHRINVDATARLLDAAAGRPVVHVSSASVYAPGAGPVREDGAGGACAVREDGAGGACAVREDGLVGAQRTAYGRTKAAGERLALGSGAVVLRPRAVYGAGDPHLLPRVRRAVRAGRLLLPGPDTRMSLTAVENLAEACLLALSWPAGPYNVADATPYPRDATMLSVLAALGQEVRPVHVPVRVAYAAAALVTRVRCAPALTPYAVDQVAHGLVLDIARARTQGYHPTHTLPDFLATLVAPRDLGLLS